MPMRTVLRTAFRLDALTDDFRLVAPGWVDQTRIDIQATIPAGRSRRDVPEMLQTLLKERFGLETHLEPRPMDVYELRVDKGGPKMTEVQPLGGRTTTTRTQHDRIFYGTAKPDHRRQTNAHDRARVDPGDNHG